MADNIRQENDYLDFIDQHERVCDRHGEESRLENFPSGSSDLRQFRQKMSKEFVQTQIKLEHVLYLNRKKWAEQHPLASWIFGSADRQMMFWMMAIQPIGEGFSPKTAGEYLQRDRTIVSKELTAMHDLGFIVRNNKEGFQRYYLPTQMLLDSAMWYSEYYVDVTLTATEHEARRHFFEYRSAEKQYFKRSRKRADDAQ